MTLTPTIKWNNTGLSAPKELDILSGRLSDVNNAFGGDLNITTLDTPQGQIASSDTVIIGEYNDILLKLVNQVDPRFADGFMQDAIGQIYFLERKPSNPTTVNVTCFGANGTIIPVGAQVKDSNGEIYFCVNEAQIDISGSIVTSFQNIKNGAIPCPAHAITTIYDRLGALGWEDVDNVSSGSLGADQESRSDFEARRTNSVFLGSQGSLDSAYAAVFNVSNVTDVYADQNLTGSPISIGSTSYSLNPKEIFICAKGGSDIAIAQAIYSKLTGATLVGNTSVDVKSAITGNTTTITFQRPSAYTIKFAVNIANSPLLPSNTADLVKASIMSAFSGNDGGEKARIGQALYASRYYAPVSTINSNIRLVSLFVGHSTANQLSVGVGVDQYPSLSISDITVNII